MAAMEGPERFSEKFRAEDAEITFKSSDDVLFKIHQVNFKAHTEGFSPPECSNFKEIVALTEPASILELLFQFIYPMPNPDLEAVDFCVLDPLAEAAEKYQVYPAMEICRIFMSKTLPEHALSILTYAMKHDYPEIMSRAAPLVLDMNWKDIMTHLPPEFLQSWAQYYDHWSQVSKNALSVHCPASNLSSSDYSVIIKNLGKGLYAFRDISSAFASASGGTVCNTWRSAIETEIKKIPPFEEIVLGPSSSHPRPGPLDKVFNQRKNGSKVSSTFADCTNSRQFKSSDEVLFWANIQFLETLAQNFPPNEPNVVQTLPEDSSTLHLLFRFLHPLPLPDLQNLDFEVMERLAHAAEKYKVYTAINVCRIYIRKTLPEHPSSIFAYATKHKCFDIADKAAPLVIDLPMSETAAMMPQDLIIPWMRYYDQWNRAAQTALGAATAPPSQSYCSSCGYNPCRHYNSSCRGTSSCNNCGSITCSFAGRMDLYWLHILKKLGAGPSSLKNLDETFDLSTACNNTNKRNEISTWRLNLEVEIKNIKPFSSMMDVTNTSV